VFACAIDSADRALEHSSLEEFARESTLDADVSFLGRVRPRAARVVCLNNRCAHSDSYHTRRADGRWRCQICETDGGACA
jgi:hypothetical protein